MIISEMELLCTIGITELLEHDDRPTFIIDISNSANFVAGNPLQIIFANPSLRSRTSLLELVSGNLSIDNSGLSVMNDFPAFKYWTLSFTQNGECQDIPLPQYQYADFSWTCNTLRKRLRLISGNTNIAPSRNPTSLQKMPPYVSEEAISQEFECNISDEIKTSDRCHPVFLSTEILNNSNENDCSSKKYKIISENLERPKKILGQPSRRFTVPKITQLRFPGDLSCDWSQLPKPATISRHIQFIRSIDWASTALGPIENWNSHLRTMSNLVMCSPHPTAIYWGDDLITMYNEAYILIAGKKHPKLMGQKFKDAWADLWGELEDTFLSAINSGLSTMKEDDCLFIQRNGFLEESYFSWSIIPLIGEGGSIVGLYNPVFDKTRQKIAERRMLMLREIGEYTSTARTVRKFWSRIIKSLENYEYDIPFALLYSLGEELNSDALSNHNSSLSNATQCILEGKLGVPENHPAALSPLNLRNNNDTFAKHLRKAMKVNEPIYFTTEDDSLSYELIDGLKSRVFGDPCRGAVVCPIRPTTGEITLGLLVIGINPRRPYDDDYSLFIQLLSRQLATTMASVVLFPEEVNRSQQAAYLAALDRQELSKQLDLRTKEAVESETKFTRMAELAPVGIFIANSEGDIIYTNEMLWEISRYSRSKKNANSWMENINDEDHEEFERSWKHLLEKKTAVTLEFRFKAPWIDRNGCRSDTWALMSAFPERDDEGNLKSVFGSITNISQQKWAEDLQKRRTEEAIEMKRQQDNFIDMTSHEMRNPLSAILQCSDEISASLTAYRTKILGEKLSDNIEMILDSSIDASQTISLCAHHQKRIVDDILTLSKLDSALLMVTPIVVQPVSVIQRALKMFQGELCTNNIALEFRMENSYQELEINHVKLDPSRLLQVLINLTTNAIKFTQSQVKRKITVSVGASMKRTKIDIPDFSYFPSRSDRKDPTIDISEWGEGEQIYLHFAVQDTGQGLDEKEKTQLFQRFSQASPRTHVQYGGSGLGLFISRELTELQGGEIGVASKPGIGSTFAFYIKARKAENIKCEEPTSSPLNAPSNNKISVNIERSSENLNLTPISPIDEIKVIETSTLEYPSQSKPSKIIDHAKIKILIVEDNLVNQRVLQKQLCKQGFQTSLANHGGEALDFLKKTTFWKGNESNGLDLSVILMDLEMPFMDGLTCCRLIREAETKGNILRHVPLIAVTANARLEHANAALAAGMDAVQAKPFLIRDLVPKIEELVK
ncbi:putative hsp90-like protein [Erysiphe necator]|uniref:Putative hsp90-like protein n=1 Tax=Uncinula necator TaxID=52586 RepID=A0A0B1PI15_UNCNE|nr:putative hsp90-like protein [Erysiphe necator]